MTTEVQAGQIWQHSNGCQYYVGGVSNTTHLSEKHPPDVVYFSFGTVEGSKYPQVQYSKLWTRPLTSWHKSMKYICDLPAYTH